MIDVRRIKKISRIREKQAASDIDGKRHAFSGALWYKKGDVGSNGFLMEDKFTEKDFFSVKLSILKKIEKEALCVLKIPVLRIGFLNNGKSEDYAILRFKDCIFLELTPAEIGNKNSYRLTAEHARESYLSNDRPMITFSIGNFFYIIMEWSEFVESRNKILSGERL